MSSIIVRGMDKPESCGKCFFRDGIFCKAKNYKRISYVALDGKIEIWCPLTEIPTPHGELVDRNGLMDTYADRLAAVAERYSPDSSECGILSGAMKLLAIQPTVIEAEE